MALQIEEWFGHPLSESSSLVDHLRESETCPFRDLRCTKRLGDGSRSGVCSVKIASEISPVIICPNRFYAQDYLMLKEVAQVAFDCDDPVISPTNYHDDIRNQGVIIAFGKNSGGELKLPSTKGTGRYFVDWVLARIEPGGELSEFVAVEVQSIDITGSYRPEVEQLRRGLKNVGISKANLNWENVNKRILPQLIYKGQVLRREPLCTKGLFFVCPTAVNTRVQERLGNNLLPYDNLQPGSISFLWYGISTLPDHQPGCKLEGRFSTTVDQVAQALNTTTNLPPQGVYEEAIRQQLARI